MKGKWHRAEYGAEPDNGVHITAIRPDPSDPSMMHVAFSRLGSISLDVRYMATAGALRQACLEFADVVLVGVPDGRAEYVAWLVRMLATPPRMADPVQSQSVLEVISQWLPLATRSTIGGLGW